MYRGIAILGLNGSGKSTLAHALANRLGYFEADLEDYYFPEQKESRIWALENSGFMDTEHLGELPFSKPRTKNEVQELVLEDIRTHSKFVISGVTMNWCDDIISRIDIVIWVRAPLNERLKRIQEREERRFGVRVMVGGDMFLQQMDFLSLIKSRKSKSVEESIKRLTCPVICIDGTQSLKDNVKIIIDKLSR